MGPKAKRREYDSDFKRQAVALVLEEGRSIADVGKNLGVHPGNVSRWVREARDNGQHAFSGKGSLTPESEELKRLREENRRLTMERDILRKATAYFAQLTK